MGFEEACKILPGSESKESGVSEASRTRGVQDFEACVHALREGTVGQDHCCVSPAAAAVFSDDRALRRIVYTDFTATGRALTCIEKFVSEHVLPMHGNPHTLSTATARQSTYFREEARQVIANYFNCTHEDAVIFTGNGATGAIDKMVGILVKSGGFNARGMQTEGGSEEQQVQSFFSKDRWNSCQCTLCGVRLKSESSFRAVRTFLSVHTCKRGHARRNALTTGTCVSHVGRCALAGF
jgi:hypothetical protein